MPFVFEQTAIHGLILVKPKVFGDQRGFFKELFKASDFEQVGLPARFCQDNLSFSRRGVLRGLHYQLPPHAQGKLVTCLQGEIYDVALDLRRSSPTFGRWLAVHLSGENHQLLYLPPGLAHGFQVLSEEALVFYKCTAEYAPEAEAGVIWNDPELAIPWPLSPPVLSERDQRWPSFREAPLFD